MASSKFVKILLRTNELLPVREFSSSSFLRKEHYKLLVAGGGAAGTAMSAKFAKKLGKGKVALIEPSEMHYYQAIWTLVGGGLRHLDQSYRLQKDIIHKDCSLIKDRVGQFIPQQNLVLTADGQEIIYDFLIIALGLDVRFDMVKGLPEAFETPGVCSNYHQNYVNKTFPAIQNFKGGNAVFTFPSTPIKCAMAGQKIMYIAEELFRKNEVRDKANITYYSGDEKLFPSPYYAEALLKVIANRKITFNNLHSLVEVRPESKEAIFEVLKDGKAIEKKAVQYEMLHISPPCSPVKEIRENKELTNADGWVTVNKHTMQHTRFPNIFSLGDCSDAPTSKTAAAVSSQSGVVRKNLTAVMNNSSPNAQYDGYTSCPLLTGTQKCILAEFDYTLKPKETFPFLDQTQESRILGYLKKEFMPRLYWNFMIP